MEPRVRTHQFQLRASMGLLAAVLIAASPAWAVNKCTGPDGKVAFQDAPCAGKGEKIVVRPASGLPGANAPAAPSLGALPTAAAPAAAAPAPVAPAAPAPTAAAKSPLVREADMCLAWYLPRLRDPAGAYYTEPAKDGRVVSMTVHATNGFGGYVTRRAGCEIHQGKLNETWTKIHAERNGW